MALNRRLRLSADVAGAECDAGDGAAVAALPEGRGRSRCLVNRRLKVTLAVVIMALSAKIVGFEFCVVRGSSMEPTLHDGDLYLVSKVSYWFSEPQRGDIVSVHPTGVPDQMVKRVIAVPGDVIQVKGGRVWLNGRPLEESYVIGPTEAGNLAVARLVPPDHLVLLGDNRPKSDDSRNWDGVFALKTNVVGKLVFGPTRLRRKDAAHARPG